MSYPPQPPSGYPQYPQQPGNGGWPGAPGGQPGWPGPQGRPPVGSPPQQPGFGAPPPGGDPWGGPPKKSKTGLIVGLSVGAVVLVGVIVLAVVLLPHLSGERQNPDIPIGAGTTTAIPIPTTRGGTTRRTTPSGSAGDLPKISVRAKAGDCLGQNPTTQALEVQTCGLPTTMLTVAKIPAGPSDCPRGYSVAESPSGYYCLTLDLKTGDCLDAAKMKQPCSSPQAVEKVLAVQPGPQTPNTCQGLGARKTTYTGPDPAQIACLGAKG